MLVWKDPYGGHVKTSVTIVWDDDGEQHKHTEIEYLPCMDFKNKSVAYENIDSMLVNKTIQRSKTKCIARLGLGAYLYAGEDLPEEMSTIKELKDKVRNLAAKKCKLSNEAAKTVTELCKAAEKQANQSLEDELITGNYNNIDSAEILNDLLNKLKTVRK